MPIIPSPRAIIPSPRLLSRRDTLLLAATVTASASLARAEGIEERRDLASAFRDQGAIGTFALYEVTGDRLTVVDRARAEKRFVPASTFKIPNSLIALETGAVRDENEVIPYGGQPQFIKAWEQDMSMAEALPISNVPVYQELARRIGLARYREFLAKLDYGNRDPGTVVDRFWLDGPLTISAVEQAQFVARLPQELLPVSARAQGIVRDLLKLESQGGATLYGKTGWYTGGTPPVGWWTGWVERGNRIHAFSLNIDMPNQADAAKRLVIGKALLKRLDVYG
jgi:beta-lactamase class D